MAQLLLEMQFDKRRELTSADKLKIVFGETKNVLLPLMHRHISENVFSSDQSSPYSVEIKKYMRYLLNNKQYLERATFVGLGIVAVGAAWEPYTEVMIGEEFLYISQMILDDICDNQFMRMNQSTINHLLGKEKAIAISEIFEAEGYRLIQKGILRLPSDKQVKIITRTFEMMKNIYYAQFIDMENSKMSVDDFGLGEYFHFLKFTTPSDIANCFYMGAVIGNADDEQANNFYELGLCIGMLMQIKDDFIDFSNQNLANKEIFLDVRNNQKRIPVILASRLAVNSERNFVRSVLGKTNLRQDEVRALREIALSDEVMDEARRVTLDIQQNALHLLEKINISREEFRLIILDILNNVRL